MKSTPPLPSIKRLVIGVTLCSLSYLALVALLYTGTFHDLAREDGVVESGGALCFLASAGLFFWMFLQLRRSQSSLPGYFGGCYWFLILAALFIFITGEEISWGQRIFGWSTPDWMKESNVQEETTIHNIEIFNGHTKDHELKPFWQSLLVMNRMFAMFWLAWCFVLPLATRFITPVRNITAWFRVPVPQVFFGCLFIATYATAKIFVLTNHPEERVLSQTDEIKEAFAAAIFLMVALDFTQRLKKARQDQRAQ